MGGSGSKDSKTSKSETGSTSLVKFLKNARDGKLDEMIRCLDESTIMVSVSNQNGLTALHMASKEGHLEIMSELLRRKAPVNAVTKKGNTPLHVACLAGSTAAMKLLVESGADVNIQSSDGFTALYMAAQENHLEVVKFLLSSGANKEITMRNKIDTFKVIFFPSNKDGYTPEMVAKQQGNTAVLEALQQSQENPPSYWSAVSQPSTYQVG